MIFNQQTLLLYGTENSEQKTMILIQGKRAIYFKYFCRMAEVIYSVIIRHIVKWTIVKRVILTGFLESGKALLILEQRPKEQNFVKSILQRR